jgi:recombination associated protein RdgC
MLFKNATIYYLETPPSQEQLSEALEHFRFKPPRPLEEVSSGWVPVEGDEEDRDLPLVFTVGGISLMCHQIESKMLPQSVINEETRKRRQEHISATGKPPSKKVVSEIKERIRQELLPKAFSKFSRIFVYIDHEREEIVLGSASNSLCGEALNGLRRALKTLKIHQLKPLKDTPDRIMTRWLKSGFPEKLAPGSEVALLDSDNSKAVFTKQDLQSSEVDICIEAGKKADRIEILWNDYIGMTLTSELIVKKIAPLSMFDPDDTQADEEGDYITTNLLLTVGALRTIIPLLESWFDIQRPESVRDPSTFISTVFDNEDADFPDEDEDSDFPNEDETEGADEMRDRAADFEMQEDEEKEEEEACPM